MSSISVMRRLLAVVMLAGLVALLPSAAAPALAQQAPAAAPEEVSKQQLRDLVSTLEDDQKRAEFLATLKAALAAQEAPEKAPPKVVPSGLAAQMLHGLSNALGSFSTEFAKLGRVFDEAPRLWRRIADSLDDPADRAETVRGLLELFVVVLAGLAAWAVAIRLLAKPRRRLEDKGADVRAWERAAILVLRLLMDLLPPVLLAVAAWGTLAAVQAKGDVRAVATVAITAIAALKIVTAVSRAVFTPHAPRLRVLPVGDETAAYLSIWVRRLSLLLIGGFFTIQALALLGLRPPTQEALTKLLGLIATGFVVVFILQNRQGVAATLRAGTRRSADAAGGRKRASHRLVDRFADVWHVLAVFYVVALYAVWAAEIRGGFLFMLRASAWSVLIIAVALGVAHLMRLAMERASALGTDYHQRFPHLEPRVNRYLPMMHSVLRGLLFVVTVLAVLQAWGLDTLVWLTEGTGQRIAGAVVTIAVVLGLALVVWEMTSSWIERYLSTTDEEGTVIERSARAKTLLPLLRNVLLVALVIIVGLIVLSEIGVNIAPLLAGAGVIGLAVGFGSQKLVQDVITGAFILFEDTLAVGDVVEVGGKAGVVEGLSIRTIRLRDLQGSVHTIPFSGVDKVTNMTKDFSFYLLEIGVAYREDTDEVTQVCVDIVEEMRHEEYFAPLILEPLEVLGVDKFADSAVVIKARIKTLPIKQWEVGREFNRRMKKAFDARGIEIPFPHQTLYFGVDKQGKAPPAHVVMDASGPPPQAPTPTPTLPPVQGAAVDLPDPDAGGDR